MSKIDDDYEEDDIEEKFNDDDFDEDDFDDDDFDDDDFDDDDDDEFEPDDIQVVSAEAEGMNVVTCFDKHGNVVDVSVMSDDEVTDEINAEEEPLNDYIDSTLLKADSTVEQVIALCMEAKKYNFASVCVNSCWIRLCAELLRGTEVSVCTVVGFPLGAMIPEAKAYEAELAIENGATEIDMVINIGAIKSKDYRMAAKDLNCVERAVHAGNALLKVIIETCLLTKEEKVIACLLAKNAGADFVKTSTGFSTAGATAEDIALMRSVVGVEMGVKAAGGIRSKEDALKMIAAGATRIGTSSGAKIVGE